MLTQQQAIDLKAIIKQEAPELDVDVVPSTQPGEYNVYHLEVQMKYRIAIRSEDEWQDRKRLMKEKKI